MEKAHRLVFNPSLMSPDNLNNSFCTFVDLASLDNPPALCRSSGRMVLEEARTVIIAKMPKKWMLEWQLRLPLQGSPTAPALTAGPPSWPVRRKEPTACTGTERWLLHCT